MKKLNLLMMLLASFTLVSLSSCGDDDDTPVTPPPTDITLAVSGGASIEMGAENISKDVTVTASSAAVKDIVVKLSSDAAEGEASFEAAEITIKAGTTVATGKITFMAAKFPKGTEAKKITVTIGTLTEGVKVDVATTDFSVRGEGAKEPANLTVTANGTSFNTTAAAAPVSVTFTLSEALTENLGIKITLGEGTSDIFKTMFPVIPTMPIVAGETTFKYDFEMPKGIAGKLVLNFAFDPANSDAILKTTTLSADFVVDAAPADPTFAIVRPTTGAIVVPNDKDIVETFKVTLSQPATEATTINLAVTSTATASGVLSAATAEFAVGEASKDVTITFAHADFTAASVLADVTVTASHATIVATTATIVYNVKGTTVVVPIKALCEVAVGGNGNYFMAKQFVVGDYTSVLHTENIPYTNLTETVIAKIKVGDNITITGKNNNSGEGDSYLAIAWVDWDGNGTIGADEIVMNEPITAGANGADSPVATKALAVRQGTKAGKYAMRIGTMFGIADDLTTLDDGCGKQETYDFTDLIIDFSL
ncbi:MAG: hypothetical protein RSB85_02140 [Rikenellaceae bacterium]